MTTPNSDKKMYTVSLDEKKYQFEAGEQAKINVFGYTGQCGATYSFYLDGQPLPTTGSLLIFTMPEHDAQITYTKEACALPLYLYKDVPPVYEMKMGPSPVKPENTSDGNADICPYCQSEIASNQKFCPECGMLLRD